MNRRQIFEAARLVIVERLQCSPSKVTERADFRQDLGADSLDQVELTAALEERFDIQITDDQAAFCETVATALDLIENKLELKLERQRRAA